MPEDLKVIPTRRICEILGITHHTLYGLVERGELRGRRAGRKCYITQRSLREFLEPNPVTAQVE